MLLGVLQLFLIHIPLLLGYVLSASLKQIDPVGKKTSCTPPRFPRFAFRLYR
jgi:hypothetical protein